MHLPSHMDLLSLFQVSTAQGQFSRNSCHTPSAQPAASLKLELFEFECPCWVNQFGHDSLWLRHKYDAEGGQSQQHLDCFFLVECFEPSVLLSVSAYQLATRRRGRNAKMLCFSRVVSVMRAGRTGIIDISWVQGTRPQQRRTMCSKMI